MEELRRRCFDCLGEALQRGTVLPGELEETVWDYYRKTAPSLQEFYSRYTPEWEVFYEHEQLLPSDFLDFLYRMQAAFRKRYSLAELDVAYYIERLERLPLLSPERKLLQELFLDKWHRLLTTKEYDYQYHHIGSLCEGFVLLDKQNGLKTVADVTGSRVRWLLLNRPELYRRIVPYEKAMEQNRHIRELVRVLGKHSKGEKRSFDPLGGVREEQLVRHAIRSDIEGITLGNDLNHLLPVEYCYLTDEALRPVFMQKFVEKRLQVFDSRSAEDSSVLQKGRKPVSGQGPFVVCLDTSGSMQGKREILAKSALLAVAKLVDGTHRKCYVINFAEDIHCMLIKDLRADFPLLADFGSVEISWGLFFILVKYCLLRIMKNDYLNMLASLVLPAQILDYFLISGVEQTSQEIHISLDEKMNSKLSNDEHFESKGFMEAVNVTDFPIRDHKVILKIRRRRWTDLRTGKSFSIPIDLDVVAKGTRYSKEFGAFLKETYGDIPSDLPYA